MSIKKNIKIIKKSKLEVVKNLKFNNIGAKIIEFKSFNK